jgi:hypothetical protein
MFFELIAIFVIKSGDKVYTSYARAVGAAAPWGLNRIVCSGYLSDNGEDSGYRLQEACNDMLLSRGQCKDVQGQDGMESRLGQGG